jgi:predicted AAA+ superfamily ATPase
MDNGLASYVTRNIDPGKAMENLVFIELLRRSSVFSKFQVYYWKEYGRAQRREVDFVIVGGGARGGSDQHDLCQFG